MFQSVHSKNSSIEGSDSSCRTSFRETAGAAPTKGTLRKAEMEFDRRQIRLKLAEKLETIGQNEDAEVLFKEAFVDEVFDEDPGEDFPWKQREAVVAAAARGGVSEDRSEGFDSMELALKAQTSAIQNFGNARTFYQPRTMTRSARALADWSSYNQASQHSLSSNTTTSDPYRNISKGSLTTSLSSQNSSKKQGLCEDNDSIRRDQLLEQQDSTTPQLFKCMYLLMAISAVIGFVYFTVYFKIGFYQSAPPGNYQLKGNGLQTGGGLPKSNGT
jgi:hypothetical protein